MRDFKENVEYCCKVACLLRVIASQSNLFEGRWPQQLFRLLIFKKMHCNKIKWSHFFTSIHLLCRGEDERKEGGGGGVAWRWIGQKSLIFSNTFFSKVLFLDSKNLETILLPARKVVEEKDLEERICITLLQF